jgi:hypothetical protein
MGVTPMKKLIDFLKSLFCKTQDHTEDTKTTDDPEVVTDDTSTDGEATVIIDNVNIVDKCECDENCDCCDCNEESCDEEESEEVTGEPDECCVQTVAKEVLVADELAVWGISKCNLNYDAIIALTKIKEAASYDEIATELAPMLDRSKGVISSSLKGLASKADFASSKYRMITDINKDDSFKDIIYNIYTWIKAL